MKDIKELIYDLLTDAEVGEYSPTLITELLEKFGKQVDRDLLKKSMDWANNEGLLEQYMWNVFCKGILELEGNYDDYTYNMEVNEVTDSYDYEKDYVEEDFKPISKKELEELEQKEEIEKYINGNEMVALPPKELLKKYCLEQEEVDLKYGKHEVHIDYYTDYYLNVDGKDWIGDFDKIYSVLENLETELEAKMSEEEKAFAQLDKTRESIINAIGNLNSDSTVKDIAKIQSSIEFYSDYYKDYNNVRPRGDIGEFYQVMKRNAPKAYAEFEALDWDEKVKLMYN